MPFPTPATNGQTYTAGGFTYIYNATKNLWVKTGYASNVQIGNVVISANVSTITVGNTSITSNAITVGNTSITANAVTVGSTNIKSNSITTGNTTISSDRISTGNTVITSNSISTGNVLITSDRISTGNTVITSNSISTGNVTISDTGIRAGNSFIASNGTATFTSLNVGKLTANISLDDLNDVVYQTSNSLQSGYATIGRVLLWNGNTWTPGDAVAQDISLVNQTTSNLAEGTNLYYTNARVAANIALLSINVLADVDTTGVTVGQVLKWNGIIWAPAGDNSGGSSETALFANTANIANVVLSLSNFTTSNLTEGINLYYTNARVYANIKPLLTTANIQEVSNLWFTNARVYANISPLLTTANVAEIVNLYYTNARVLSFVSNVPIPNITVANIRMSSTATIESTGDTNTIIKANVFNYEFRDSGFATFPNLNITSNLVLNSRLVVNSTARLSGNIIPLVDNTFDLGSPINRFRSVYISGSAIDIGSGLIKFEDGKFKFQTADGAPAKTELYTGNIIEAGDTTTGNVYFTNARARAAIANGNGILYDVTTGIISIGQNATVSTTFSNLNVSGNITAANYFGNVKSLAGLTTDNLLEGSNLYFTNARARAAISAGDNTIIYDPITGQIRATANVTAQVYTTISGLTTSNVAEGANLYFTNARARLAISGGTGVNYDNTTGVISIGQNVATTSDVTFKNLTLTGNLNVIGNVVGFAANNLVINDGLIQLGNANPSDSIDLGFIAHYFSGSQKHTGLFRDASDGGIYKFFEGYPLEPGTAVIDTSNVFFSLANVAVNNLYGNVNWSNIVSKPSPVVTLSITGDVSGTASATLQNLTSNTISISVATKGSTSNIAEGSNLYYTNARVLSVVAQSNIANLTVTSNIVAGNVIATRFFGDGSQLTGISASAIAGVNTSNLSLLPTYNGNALIGNLVVSGNATAGNILLVLGNGSITGNLAVGNVNATRFVGDGSQLTGISTTGVSEGANLYYTNARVASYVANVQLPNLTVSGNVSAGNVLVSNFITKSAGTGNITVLTSGNIILDTGATRTRFFDTGNVVFPGNVVAGTFFVGNGSLLTGIATSLSGMATYAGNILATNIVSNVLTVTGNITAANLVSGNSYLSFTNDSNVLIYAGNALYRFNDTGNLIIPGNLVTGNSSLTFTNDSNIVLTAGLAVYRFGDNSSANLPNIFVTGNVTASNVIASFFVGNGSLLTGVVSSQTVTTAVANSSLSNLTVTGTIVSGNVSLSGRLYGNVTGNAAIFTQNVVSGNYYIDPVANGRFYGNVTANTALFTGNVFFTSNSGILANIAIFTGNVSVGNIVVGNVISTPAGSNANLIIDPDGTGEVIFPVNTEVVIQSTIQANSNTTGALIITGGLGVGGNIYSGANIVATGNVYGTYFVGNGSLLTGIATSLSGLATYNGNALISNLVVTSNLNLLGNLTVANITANTVTVTGNLNIGTIAGTSITTTSDNNTIIRAGTTSYLFGDGGRAEFPNLLVNGNITATGNISGSFFFGNGALLTGITASTVDLKTYGGNILASNIVANTITTGNLFIGNTGAALVSISNDNNTKIQSGSATYLFPDNNRAELPNLLVVGNVTVGLSNAAVYASSGDANTLIRAGDKTYAFTDRGDAIFPNLIVAGNLTIGNASVSTNSVDNNTIIKAGTSFYTFSDGNYAIMPNLLINGNVTVGPTLSSGAVFTNNSLDNNTVIRSGSTVYYFGDGGAALFPNLIIGSGTDGTLRIGDGGSVTQATSRSTSVAINKPTGRITLVSAFASTTANTFQVVNNTVTSTDVIILNQQAGIDRYATFVSNVQTNSFNVTFYAVAASATEQPVFNFVVIKGSAT